MTAMSVAFTLVIINARLIVVILDITNDTTTIKGADSILTLLIWITRNWCNRHTLIDVLTRVSPVKFLQ